MAIGSVAVAVLDGAPLYELAIPCDVFGRHRTEVAASWYDFRLCAELPVARVGAGFVPDTPYRLADLAGADTVIIPAVRDPAAEPPAELLDAVRAAHRNGARLVSLCTGAFVLAAAGLLDGRPAATHWIHADLLAERYPAVRVDPAVLYIDDGDILTSAGNTAGLDLCLYLVRADHGAAVANAIARRLVMPAHREGGQAQYIEPAGGGGTDELGPVLDWARTRLDRPLSIAEMAAHAHLTPRTLIRRFHAALGTTPMNWLLGERVRRARELLETTDLPVDTIAGRTGLGAGPNLRHHFTRVLGVPPSTYRRAFRAAS